jgi:tRNA nucleotidyltransferase (CCA-adding enzyme)
MAETAGLFDCLPCELAHLAGSLATDVAKAGGRLLLVGGCVRDAILESTPREIDCEVQGLSLAQLNSSLSPKYQCVEVGKAFGVLKLRGLPAELSLPRT